MTNAWDVAKGLAEKHAQSGGIFVRLANNGDKVTGVFCGEPFAREVVWTGEHYEAYDPKNPEHQADGKRPSLRVAMNFYVIAENAMKVIEGGSQWFKDVLKLRDKYGLGVWSFEIERRGEAGDPKTRYSMLPEEKLGDELRKKIAATALHDLPNVAGGDGAGEGATTAPAVKDGPIDTPTATALVARLKALPRAAVDGVLGELGVSRVRELSMAKAARANALLDQLAGGAGGAGVEIDPFA
jgi:hypothetical protein